MNKFALTIFNSVAEFFNRSLIKNLLIITLCVLLVFLQLFFPYQYYASAQRSNSGFEVGIHYVYEQDELEQIEAQVLRIKELGFKVIRITLECDTQDYTHIQNRKTDALFTSAESYGLDVSLVIKTLDHPEKVDYYLDRWGHYLSYIQIFNEPELSSTWTLGAMFTDDEIISKFNIMYNTVEAHDLDAKLYTNFGIGYIIRTNVPIVLSEKLDFVGLDIFMDAFLVLSPHFIDNLQKITGKDVIITEFGMSTSDKQDQTDYILKGLNLYKNMGLNGCWLVYWNSNADNYGIRGTSTEYAVGEWIAKNTV